MPKRLSQEQVDHYHEHGYVSPIPVLNQDEVARLRSELERHEAEAGHPMEFPEKSKAYLLYNWADEIVHHPAILDAVEDIIGPDILIYHQTIWIKEPGTPNYVLWHQDGKYFFLEPHLHITAWVALSEVSLESGCVHALPGSHTWGDYEHVDDTGDHTLFDVLDVRRHLGGRDFSIGDGYHIGKSTAHVNRHHRDTPPTNRFLHMRSCPLIDCR